MPFSMIAGKKTAPLAALIRKLAFNDARATSSVQATRLFNTNGMREVEALDGKSNLGRGSDRKVGWRRARDNGVSDSFSQIRTEDLTSPAGVPAAVPRSKRINYYQIEYANRIEIRMNMPGLGKEHVNLRVRQNNLTVKGDGEEEKGEEEGARRYHTIIDFDDVYKLNEIEAEMKNGILKIVVPKEKLEERRNDEFQVDVK